MVGNGYYVIDAHCHIYPEKIAAAAVGNTDRFYGVTSACLGTVQDLLARDEEAGIDHAVVQSVATTPKQVKSINEFIAGQVSASGGRFTGLGTLHPDSSDQEGDLEYLISLGLHGVKLHPDIQNFKIDDYRGLKIYELCEKHRIPVLMHTGDSRYDRSNPNRLMPVLSIYTGLTVIGAHFGGWSIWESAADELHGRFPNLYVDCSSSLYRLPPDAARRIISEFGADRVLFGTDYPMWSPASEIKSFLSLGFDDETNRKILGENARRVYGIQ